MPILKLKRTSGQAVRLETDSGPVDLLIHYNPRLNSIELVFCAPQSVRILREELLSETERASLNANLGGPVRSLERYLATTGKRVPNAP
jgi:sRNA-binding carbon storage regulator CsrA